MDKDRTEIHNIISEMLDNRNQHGIYPTNTAYTKLELYIEGQRFEAIGWTHANACSALDKGNDPRLQDVPEMLEKAKRDLAK
jgi:hypothetical protein